MDDDDDDGIEKERKEEGGRRRRNLQFTGAGAVLDLRYVRTTSKIKKKKKCES